MDLERLKELIDLVSNTRVATLEVEEDGWRVRIGASSTGLDDPAVSASQIEPSCDVEIVNEVQVPDPASEAGDVVRAPLYGLLYLTPSPEAVPFVSVGDVVEEGQTLCMIESMKVLSPVLATKAGTIAAILAESETEVESGQPLIRIE